MNINLSEHEEQCLVIEWARRAEGVEPRLKLLYAIPNGAKLPWTRSERGTRYSPEAMRLKAEGLRPGVPDLCLPVPAHGFHAMYVEMKSATGTLSEDQKEFMAHLKAQGNYVVACWGAEAAIREIGQYLDMPFQPDLGLPARSTSKVKVFDK